jgi:hypothetical protein
MIVVQNADAGSDSHPPRSHRLALIPSATAAIPLLGHDARIGLQATSLLVGARAWRSACLACRPWSQLDTVAEG